MNRKGSKKLFFKNFMDARVNYIILPVARKLMEPEQAAKVSSEGYLLGTITHEICHGLGPAFARTSVAGKIDIREAIGPAFSGVEEAKADVTGMFASEMAGGPRRASERKAGRVLRVVRGRPVSARCALGQRKRTVKRR